MKNIKFFYLILVVKVSVYLNRRVFVMISLCACKFMSPGYSAVTEDPKRTIISSYHQLTLRCTTRKTHISRDLNGVFIFTIFACRLGQTNVEETGI